MKEVTTTSAHLMNEASKARALEALSEWLNGRNEFFSGVIGEAVTNRKALLFVQCVVAMLTMIGMAEVNLFGFVLCFGWLICAAMLFSKEGGEE